MFDFYELDPKTNRQKFSFKKMVGELLHYGSLSFSWSSPWVG